jgi:hypothetical protein
MLVINPQQLKYHRFKEYVRICFRCDEFFNTDRKGTKYCDKCLAIIKEDRIVKSLNARGIKRKEVQTNELNKDN